MASTQSKLGASYVLSNWIVLSLSTALFLYCYAGSDINVNLIPANNSDRKVTAYTAVIFFILSWIYQAIQWRLEDNESKVKYLSQSVHIGVNLIALLVSYLCYPVLKIGTYFESISFWWIPSYIALGLISGFLVTVLCLAALSRRTTEEALKLSLPIFPYASKAQFKLWLPVLVLVMTSYFGIQSTVSSEVRLLGTVLFAISFLKEIVIGLIPFFFSQDSEGNRLSFPDRASRLNKAFNRHDYYMRMKKAFELGEIPKVDTTLPPPELQKSVVRELNHEHPIEFQGKFLGQDQSGNLKMEVTFKDKTIPHVFVDVPNDYFQTSLSAYVEINKPTSEADMHKAISHAFNQATIKALSDKNNIESNLGQLVQARQYDVLLQRLEEKKEDVNKTGEFGWTPLCHAAANGDLKALSMLLDHAADPDIKNIIENAPLHYGARYLNLKICKLLLDYGANPNTQDAQGATPLMIASKLGGLEIVKLLLKGNADVSIKDHSKHDALKYATDLKRGNIARILRNQSNR